MRKKGVIIQDNFDKQNSVSTKNFWSLNIKKPFKRQAREWAKLFAVFDKGLVYRID